MLKVVDLEVYYGAIKALKGISFQVNKGEIVTLIGANGAGKTTTLNSISALVHIKSGSVSFMDIDLKTLPAYQRIYKGIAHVRKGAGILQYERKKRNGRL